MREGLQPKVISVFGGSCTLYFVFCTLILCYYVHFDVKSVKIMITYFMITIAHETTYNFVQKISFYENNNLCKKFKIIHWWCRVIFLCSKILQSANSLKYLYLQIWSYFVKKQWKIIENYKLRKETFFALPSLWQPPMEIWTISPNFGSEGQKINSFFNLTSFK